MAHEVIGTYGHNVRIITRPPHGVVVQEWGSADWKDVHVYDRMSDDMAWSNARDHAARLARQKPATP